MPLSFIKLLSGRGKFPFHGCSMTCLANFSLTLFFRVAKVDQTGFGITDCRLKGRGMNISAKSLRFDDDSMWVDLSDGRTLGIPLAWFPRLLNATPAQRLRYEISAEG